MGLDFEFYAPFYFTTADATQPITGSLSVTVRDNVLNRNFDYGIIVHPANISRSNPRQFTGTIVGTFEHNAVIGNAAKRPCSASGI